MTISGDNTGLVEPWAFGAEVTVEIVGPNGILHYEPLTTYVGMDGGWSCQFTLSEDPVFAVGQYTYTASAAGSYETQSGTFTDGVKTRLTVTPASATYGDSVALSATLEKKQGNDWVVWPGASVAFSVQGMSVGSRTTNSSGVATLNGVSTSGIGAGTYSSGVTASYSGDTGLDGSSGSASLTIAPRPVKVTADAKSKTYGEVDPPLTYQITSGSLVGSDAFTGALTRDVGETVGSYTIRQGTLALSRNYTLTYVGANLTIAKRDLTVTATGVDRVYDGTAVATVTLASDALEGDDVALAYTAASFADKNVDEARRDRRGYLDRRRRRRQLQPPEHHRRDDGDDHQARDLTVTASGIDSDLRRHRGGHRDR